MEKIRVLQVFTVLDIGGAETNLMNYYRKLPKDKIQMDFLVHREKGFFEEELLISGSKIYRLPAIHPLKLIAYKKAVDLFFKEQANNYDIVHGQLSELGVFIYESAKKYGVPVRIAHAHNSKMDIDLKAPFRYFWKKRMLKSINGYFSCGQESSVWLFGKKQAKNAFIMPNSIDVAQFQYNPQVHEQYEKEFQFSTPHTFLHVGRFSNQKNHAFLIEVFLKILEKQPDAKLLLVGEGELKSKIIAQVESLQITNTVRFLGQRTDVNQLMQWCNYFIFPSLFEGFGVALVEAQASGMYSFISNKIASESQIIKSNICVLDLNLGVQYWSNVIVQKIQKRIRINKDFFKSIKSAGYDVNDNTDLLINQYYKLLKKNEKI